MTWGKVDDKLHSSPKWLATPPRSRGLWVTALSWSMAQLTDGHVPTTALPLLGARKPDAEALVTSGLWERTDGGYLFHDWADYQPDAASIRAKRTKESAGGEKGNHTRWHTRRGVVVPDCEWCKSSGTRSGTRRGTRVTPDSGANPPVPVPHIESERGTSPQRSDRETAPPQLETSIPRHVLPASWAPTTAHKAYSLENGIDLKHEDRQFRAHCKSKRVTSLDWDAEFDKWLGNAVTRRRPSGAADRPRPGSSVWDKPARGDEPA